MKKTIVLFLIILLANLGLDAQNLINNNWLLKTGDDLSWKETGLNISDWKPVKAGMNWESQGFPEYDGFGWYRKSVVIPENLKAQATEFGGLLLYLGTIDDSEQIYFNGELVAQNGSFPPSFESAYGVDRKVIIAPELVQWGAENIIAVRVFDGGGGGGLVTEKVSLTARNIDSQIQMNTDFRSKNHVYLNGNPVSFDQTVQNTYKKPINGELIWLVVSDFGDTTFVKKQDIRVASNKKIQLNTKLNHTFTPGFYTLISKFRNSAFSMEQHYGFGIDPEKVVSPQNKPADLDAYWARAKRELAAVDPQFKLIPQPNLSTDKREVFLVEMRSLYNVLIRGWYARPKKEGKYPAILHVQGYSSSQTMNNGYGGDDMVVFVLNIRGHGNSRDNVNPGFPGFLTSSITDKEQYIYRGAYMDCIRAVDFLCSQTSVDTSKVIVEGGSQGGALSIATAALDNKRIKLCVPAVPFLSDFQDYFKLAPWPFNEFKAFVKEKNANWTDVYNTLSYIDIKNLADKITCPVFMSIGLIDTTCPPHINFAVYNQIKSSKNYQIYPTSGHGLPADYYNLKFQWIKSQLDKLK